MPSLTIINNIDSLQNFMDAVDGNNTNEKTNLWFRGVGNANYQLKPSIHRHSDITTEAKLFEYEKKLINRFRERSVPYLQSRIEDHWELLFLMQHYGMPTRVLDWTENPFIALFFALSSASKNNTNEYDNDAAVWMLSPSNWNQCVFKHNSFTGSALSPSDTLVSSYKPEPDVNYVNANPVAILGIHNSPRIVAQRGAFCLFGKSLSSMEDIYTAGDFAQDTLQKIIIPKEKINLLLDKLLWMGITDAVIYPDLDGLAKETKRQFGFKV